MRVGVKYVWHDTHSVLSAVVLQKSLKFIGSQMIARGHHVYPTALSNNTELNAESSWSWSTSPVSVSLSLLPVCLMHFWGHPFLSSLPQRGGVCMGIRESECVTLGAGGPICLNTAESYSGNLSHNPLCLDGQMLSSSKPHSPNAWGSLAAPYSSYFLCWEFWCSNSLWSSVTYSKDGQKSLESWSLLFSCLKISHCILAWNEVTAAPALKHKHKLWRSNEKFSQFFKNIFLDIVIMSWWREYFNLITSLCWFKCKWVSLSFLGMHISVPYLYFTVLFSMCILWTDYRNCNYWVKVLTLNLLRDAPIW